MKLISPKLHGIIDYIVVVYLLISPNLLSMPTKTGMYTYLLGIFYLFLTILTDYSYGIFKSISISTHGWLELAISVGIIVLSFTVLNYDMRAKPFYAPLGIFLFIITVFTDYNKARDGAKSPIL